MKTKRDDRTDIKTVTSLCNFSTGGPLKEFRGEILNCSPEGVCVEINEPVDTGAVFMLKTVEIQFESYPSDKTKYIRMYSLAEVKWSKPIEPPDRGRYVIGMRYI